MAPGTKLMAVVKADAYGHGEKEVLKKLNEIGIKYFAVSNLDEAISVRNVCPSQEILILGYTPPEYADEIIKYNIIQCIVSEEYAVLLGKNAPSEVRCPTSVMFITLLTSYPENLKNFSKTSSIM